MLKFFTKVLFLFTLILFTTGCSTKQGTITRSDIINKDVDSLNILSIKEAKLSYKKAKAIEADYFAPVTFKLADKNLKKALSIIETDYSKSFEIDVLAKRANMNYKKAIRITKMSKNFEKKDFANEDYILWYWEQLKNINTQSKTKIDFSLENTIVVNNMKVNILTLSQSLEKSRADCQKLSLKYTELKKLKAKKEKKITLYDFAKSEFDINEAVVSKKENGIFLFITGFKFLDKRPDLGSENFKLINKIARIVKQVPKYSIEIIAHTDSIGTVMQNQKLSASRAKNVLKTLAKIGLVDTARMTIKAYGESKPVVSNMLKAGRAKNRRIEIYIHK